MDFDAQLKTYRARVEDGIRLFLPEENERPGRLHRAMRYSMAAGGKRIRPVLCLAVADLYSNSVDPLPAAVAIECIHTYSLIHDDLPCMDDGLLRRGRPTCHREFDEATALLAGDALLTFAFELLAGRYREAPEVGMGLTLELSRAAGSRRLIGGQMEDIENEGNPDTDLAGLLWINENKTAALLAASLVMGGLIGGTARDDIERLRELGRHAGMAFQIIDDVLDATSSESAIGKTTGADARQEKKTFVSFHGVDGARSVARDHTRSAREICGALPGDTAFLINLLERLENRIR